MSSMVLDVNKYSKAARMLYGVLYDQRFEAYLPSELRSLANHLNRDLYGSERLDKIMRAMYRMNLNAFNVRYRWQDGQDSKYFKGEYQPLNIVAYPRPKFKEYVQLLQFLRCALYQCCEGYYPEKRFYKFLSEFIEALYAHAINYQGDINEQSLADQYSKWGEL
jgi:hypothetical protein